MKISQNTARTVTGSLPQATAFKAGKARLANPLKRKAARRRFVNLGIVAGNLLLLAVVAAVVLVEPGKSSASTQVNNFSTVSADQLLPQDQLASASIAATAAKMAGVGELIPITNQLDTARAMDSQVALADNTLSSKPQIVASPFKSSQEIQLYKVQPGDSLSSIADKFGISTNSIRWSNGISGFSAPVGKTLRIPPIDGIIYKVKGGDTAGTLADEYNISKSKIVHFNDAEVSGLEVGSYILLPGAIKQVTPSYHAVVYGYNGYDPGWCTWYVASRINVPVGWGNANTWDYYAARTPGWIVSQTPKVGAIAQHNRGWAGHVAVVEAVKDGGSMIKYSDMNGLAGFGNVGYSGWVPASHFDNYIYR